MYFGNVCQSSPPPLTCPTLGRPQPSADLKCLLPFQLLPSFSKMDHVHKALAAPGLGLTTPSKRRHSSCGVCRLKFNSEMQASSHYSGTRHAKRLKAMDAKIRTSEPVAKETTSQILTSPCAEPSSSDTSEVPAATASSEAPASSGGGSADTSLSPIAPPRTGPEAEEAEKEMETETEEEKARRLLYCSLCKVAVNSATQLQAHNSGTKHKTMLDARSGDGAIKSFPRSGVKAKFTAQSETPTGLQNKTFHCEICDVHVNSETQLKQHISSRRHKDRAAGKPAKPKFSPYGPTQRQQGPRAVRLALRKEQDLIKPLSSCLVRRQRSAATAAAMATLLPFHLRATPNSGPSLFPTQPLAQALLHPAARPICSAHTPVLFSPY